MSVDAKFVNAPFQLDQLTGARGRFPQYLMEIMRDLPDPRAIAAGSRLLTGSDSPGRLSVSWHTRIENLLGSCSDVLQKL